MSLGHPGRRARILLIAMLFIFSLFAAQIVRVQGVDAAAVSLKAKDSRLRSLTVPASRGQIVDSKGTALAVSVRRYDVTADATQTAQYKRVVNKKTTVLGNSGVAVALASVLGGDPRQYYATLQKGTERKAKFVYLIKNITPAQWTKVAALNLSGIYSAATDERQYPQGASASSIVGWTGGDLSAGAGGVELMKQSVLNGTPGSRTYEEAPDGTVIATGSSADTPAVNGQNVKLTLDSDIQYFASTALAQQVKKMRAEAGDLVVMDRNGNILAAASYPTFNPLQPGKTPGNLQSRPFAVAYEPGSTSKVITMAAALSAGVVTPLSPIVVPPVLYRGGTKFKDSEDHGTENLTLAGVLAKSSNMGTILAGSRIPSSTLYDYMRKFGLGTTSGIGFPGESAGLVSPPAQWSASQKYTVMFGQGLSTTLLQQASVYQTIANDGVRLPPKLIAGVSNSSGGWTAPKDTRKPVQVVSAKVAGEMRTMLNGVVTKKGTANLANVPGYNVSGKTGTADAYDAKLGRYSGYTASFIGMAPAENPQYIIAVSLQRPKATIYGGDAAAPVFSQVAGFVLRSHGVPPSRGPAALYPLQFTAVATKQQP
ncbi:penicillin-binding protein 2 [Dermatophilaceae bacterium Sec6.4]|nr:penicillin-binding protein 2 [Actinomycetota bacterium]